METTANNLSYCHWGGSLIDTVWATACCVWALPEHSVAGSSRKEDGVSEWRRK